MLHPIGEDSPLHGATEASMKGQDVEILISVSGLDGTSSQTIHGSWRYLPEDVRFGFRYADMLSGKPDGRLELDYSEAARAHAGSPVTSPLSRSAWRMSSTLR